MVCKQLCGGTSCFVLDVVLPQSSSANAEINPVIVNAAKGFRILKTYTSRASERPKPGLKSESKKLRARVRAGD
jgi:hypothetical protein